MYCAWSRDVQRQAPTVSLVSLILGSYPDSGILHHLSCMYCGCDAEVEDCWCRCYHLGVRTSLRKHGVPSDLHKLSCRALQEGEQPTLQEKEQPAPEKEDPESVTKKWGLEAGLWKVNSYWIRYKVQGSLPWHDKKTICTC